MWIFDAEFLFEVDSTDCAKQIEFGNWTENLNQTVEFINALKLMPLSQKFLCMYRTENLNQINLIWKFRFKYLN